MTRGYKHRECGRCGTEIGFNESFQDCTEYAICNDCVREIADAKAKPFMDIMEEVYNVRFVDVAPDKKA
jgi:ribosomal protein S14